MVDGIKCYANVYFKDGYVEEIDNQKWAALNDRINPCNFVEFETSRGMYGYVSGSEVVVGDNGEFKYKSFVTYLKHDKETGKWSPTDEIEKVIVTRMESDRGETLRFR